MSWFEHDQAQDANQQMYQDDFPQQHEASKLHELIGGGAAFEAMHLYENKERAEGKQVNHGFAKELLAGFVGAEVDKYAETKGEDFFDKEEAKRQGRQKVEAMYDERYQGDNNGQYPGYEQRQAPQMNDYQQQQYDQYQQRY